MKRYILIFLIPILLLTACSPKGANTLIKQAKRMHGSCTVVSKSESDEATVVTLHDELQDFDYRISSSMNEILIDGSSFGSVAGTDDTFTAELKNKVTANVKDSLDAVCAKYGTRYIPNNGDDERIIIILSGDGDKGRKTALECAGLLQEQNIQNRLDGMEISVYGDTDEDWWASEHYGSVKLPAVSWRTPEDERTDYYTEMAHMQTDRNAVYLRTEHGTFADTGADLRKVTSVLGTDYPTSPDSPVTFYYFRASDGTEYYLCDFNYSDETGGQAWYTNYAE